MLTRIYQHCPTSFGPYRGPYSWTNATALRLRTRILNRSFGIKFLFLQQSSKIEFDSINCKLLQLFRKCNTLRNFVDNRTILTTINIINNSWSYTQTWFLSISLLRYRGAWRLSLALSFHDLDSDILIRGAITTSQIKTHLLLPV